MTRFLDGPVEGVTLSLARAPKFLRVVRNQTIVGDMLWDALDQLHDMPKFNETVHVYRLVSNDGSMHLSGRTKEGKRFGRWEPLAQYAYHDSQPDDATARDTMLWREWAQAENERLKTANPEVK